MTLFICSFFQKDQFDKEVNDLIEWSENLDYENYIRNWYVLSTSNASNFYSQVKYEKYLFLVWLYCIDVSGNRTTRILSIIIKRIKMILYKEK